MGFRFVTFIFKDIVAADTGCQLLATGFQPKPAASFGFGSFAFS
jgi:hypothetical protein